MIRWLLAILAALSPVDATAPAERGRVQLPAPPEAMPATEYDDLFALSWTDGRCTRTTIGPTTVTAAHCVDNKTGWSIDGDRAWLGPEPDWAVNVPRGATITAVGYPAATGRTPVAYTLAALDPQTVTIVTGSFPVLMTLGEGIPCTSGDSGMMGWVTVDNVRRPVGPMSVFSIDPAVTGLPAGQYVCGFAI